MPSHKVISYFQDFIVAARTYFSRRTGAWTKLAYFALVSAVMGLASSALQFKSLVQFDITRTVWSPMAPSFRGSTAVSMGRRSLVARMVTARCSSSLRRTVTILYQFLFSVQMYGRRPS